jgi:Aminopeptidase I zinc metalloprotease (M18)
VRGVNSAWDGYSSHSKGLPLPGSFIHSKNAGGGHDQFTYLIRSTPYILIREPACISQSTNPLLSTRARREDIQDPSAKALHLAHYMRAAISLRDRVARLYSTMSASTTPAANDFLSFVNASPTPFHAVQRVKERLAKAGFQEIKVRPLIV